MGEQMLPKALSSCQYCSVDIQEIGGVKLCARSSSHWHHDCFSHIFYVAILNDAPRITIMARTKDIDTGTPDLTVIAGGKEPTGKLTAKQFAFVQAILKGANQSDA
jgi:hypothetical protein